MPSAQEQFDTAIAEVLAHWGQPFSAANDQLRAAIEALYRAELDFPPSWPEHRRQAFITNHADCAAGELATQFDDLIDTVVNEYGLAYGVMPHSEDASDMIQAAREEAVADLIERRLNYELQDDIEQELQEDPWPQPEQRLTDPHVST